MTPPTSALICRSAPRLLIPSWFATLRDIVQLPETRPEEHPMNTNALIHREVQHPHMRRMFLLTLAQIYSLPTHRGPR